MPIFEQDEPITPEEMRRQQKDLNLKVFRKKWADFCIQEDETFSGGDCWNEEELE